MLTRLRQNVTSCQVTLTVSKSVTAACNRDEPDLDIARVYIELRDAEEALKWLGTSGEHRKRLNDAFHACPLLLSLGLARLRTCPPNQVKLSRRTSPSTGSPASREASRFTSNSATQSLSPMASTIICSTRQLAPSSAGVT